MKEKEQMSGQYAAGEEFDTPCTESEEVCAELREESVTPGQEMNGQNTFPGMQRRRMRPGMGQGGQSQGMGQRPGNGMGPRGGKKDDTPEVIKFFRTMFSRKLVLIGFSVFLVFAVMAIFAPVISRYDPASMDYQAILEGPSLAHWLGTDNYGRDTFARLIYGARISLVIGVVAVAIAAVVGITLGLIAGYFGGAVDVIISRIMEAFNAIPNVMLSLALIAAIGNTILDMAVVLSVVTIPSYVRMTRSMTLSQKNSDSVKAAEMAGAGSWYVIFKHILPNVMSPNIIMIMSNVGTTILLESGLSFLGVGISIPTPSWGTMVADGRAYLLSNPYISIVPGLCVALLVISLNLLGDGIRDAMDPRLRGMH